MAQEGDLVLLIAPNRKQFIVRLEQGGELQTHRGVIRFDDLIGQPLGREVRTHLGHPFLALEPSLHDLIRDLRRITQIMFPKDVGYLLLKSDTGSGPRCQSYGPGFLLRGAARGRRSGPQESGARGVAGVGGA
jgi:tRNA (adenine57-N1/adenine58-N1)-methyltransferase